jgi:molybdopterin-guanine dinucleotide biosynthesis protein A
MAALLDGVPLLHRAIAALASVCTEVVVVASPDGLNMPLPRRVRAPLRVTLDPRPFEGPLVGALAGAEEAIESLVVVVGGDMPELVPAVIGLMLRRMAGPADAIGRRDGYWDAQGVALEVEGKARPLPLVLDRTAAVPAAADLVSTGVGRLGALFDVLDIAVIPEAEWRALDPDGRTLRDIDLPADLA